MPVRIPAPLPAGQSANYTPANGVFMGDDGQSVTLQAGPTGFVQVGQPGAVNGNGVRNGSSRNIIANKPTAVVDASGGITATVAQVLEAAIFTATGTANLTLPTAQGASGLVQALPGAQVGDLFEIQVCCSHATQVVTLVAGTGSTIFGQAAAAAAQGSRIWRGRITAITAGSETITWY